MVLCALVVGAFWVALNPFAASLTTKAEAISPTASPVLFGPTKFARLLPTNTPVPTDIPTFTPTSVPSLSPTSTRRPTEAATPIPPTPAATLTTVAVRAANAPAVAPRVPAPFVSTEQYASMNIAGAPTDRRAETHPDLNLGVRGWELTHVALALIDYDGLTDAGAPQLADLFDNHRTPVFTSAYRVFDWDWGCNCRGDAITDWPATLMGIQTTPNEVIRMPDADTNIGGGYVALVLYADTQRITLKYTREDNVLHGYTLHLEGVTVDANLLALYRTLDRNGRWDLPTLRPRQVIGVARGNEMLVSIRDSGAFLDPRSRKDWWKGK